MTEKSRNTRAPRRILIPLAIAALMGLLLVGMAGMRTARRIVSEVRRDLLHSGPYIANRSTERVATVEPIATGP